MWWGEGLSPGDALCQLRWAPAWSLGLARSCCLPGTAAGGLAKQDKAFPSWQEEPLGSCCFEELFCSRAPCAYIWDSAPRPERGFAQLRCLEDWALL